MDLVSAIGKHAEWRTKFRSAMAKHESLDAVAIGRDDGCELGKWLHGPARAQFGKLPAYADCVRMHAAFHSHAAKVAGTINAKKYSEAEAMLGSSSPYADASSSVGTAIMQLKKQAGL